MDKFETIENGIKGKNYFEILNSINVNDKTESKNGLTYLSWAFAWGELKKRFPDATYTVYENDKGWNYFTDDMTCWVKTGVTVNGIEHIEYLPIMDFKNRSIPLGSVTSFDVNKAIQRSLTKAIGRHGLGLYIYAGEDIPSESDGQNATDYRAMLHGLVKDKNLDGNAIIAACKLTRNSTNKEWKAAFEYACNIVKEQKQS